MRNLIIAWGLSLGLIAAGGRTFGLRICRKEKPARSRL